MTDTTAADLPREYQIALNCTHDTPEAELAGVEHVLACANTTCRSCARPVDVSGSPEVAMCGGCLERNRIEITEEMLDDECDHGIPRIGLCHACLRDEEASATGRRGTRPPANLDRSGGMTIRRVDPLGCRESVRIDDMARPKLSHDPLFRVTVTAEEKVVEEFDDACRALGLTRSEVMRRLMRQWIHDNKDVAAYSQEVLPVAS